MHSRRFACLLLGLWLGGGLSMGWVAIESSGAVDRLLAEPHPAAALHIKALGPAEARLLLNYQLAERNRWLVEGWEIAQIVLGLFLLFFLLFGTSEDKFSLLMALLMVVAVLVQRFLLTPEVAGLGRMTDFVPDVPSTEHAKLAVLQTTYMGVEIAKWGFGFLLAGRFIVGRRGRSGDARQEFDLIDKANHRHVDG